MMSERKPVKLIVSDIDNTISDYFNNWGLAWDKGIEALAASRGMEKDALYADIRENADGYARFHNFPDLLKETPSLSLEGKSPEERARLEKAMLRFAMMWLNSTTAAIKCTKALSPRSARPKPPALSLFYIRILRLPARLPVWRT